MLREVVFNKMQIHGRLNFWVTSRDNLRKDSVYWKKANQSIARCRRLESKQYFYYIVPGSIVHRIVVLYLYSELHDNKRVPGIPADY